jgi:hypothetical protein
MLGVKDVNEPCHLRNAVPAPLQVLVKLPKLLSNLREA